MLEDWPPFRSLTDIGEAEHGAEVAVAGWLEDVRDLGGIAFLILREREGTLQLTVKPDQPEEVRALTGLSRESVVAVRGTVQPNEKVRNGWEILPSAVEVLSEAAKPLPLGVVDKVGAEMDTRLDNRFLDLRKEEVRAVFRLKSLAGAALRTYMRREGFVETHTPKVISAGAEGGATLFRVDYFGQPAYLAQSPQLYKQILMSTGLDRVYELAPAFRAELSDTVRHIAEFLSFDAEMAFIRSQEEVLRVLEGAVVHTLATLRDEAGADLERLGVELEVPRTPVPRIPYEEARKTLAEHGVQVPDGEDLDTEAEKALGQAMAEEGHELFFVVEYPSAIKPFYIMEKDDDPEFSHSFDLDYRGDEMASGGQREHRVDRIVARMERQGLDPEDFAFYLNAFRYGMPPHGGWGFGLDRFVWKVAGLGNVREAILFPRDRSRLVP
ncbi:MAG: aspartate--tRNA(Asn) ligase [Thermoplasmata archaeon]|nr:aspartate--tRNA(Asn) ligase [Thermoplasmata archaeon]